MKKSRLGKLSRYLIGAAALVTATAPANAALTFNLTYIPGTSVQAQNAFQAAAARWSAVFTDNITINLTVGTAALGTGILGSTASSASFYSYSSFRAALAADATSADDASAVASLATGSTFNMLLNRTSNNPNGAGSATPYLDNDGDANNQTVRLNSANVKALGTNVAGTVVGACTSACDGSVTFSTLFDFDFDPSDGITAGQFDFVGVATHEIGHALGFVSGVDILDINSTGTFFPDNAFTYATSLDMFRYSAASCQQGVVDFTADTRAKFFSIDGCATQGPGFSTGRTWGDGQQASHWKDNLGIGIMDPTAARGELLSISENDLRAFDVIGWNRAVAVPEPATWAMMIGGFGMIGAAARRRRSKTLAAA